MTATPFWAVTPKPTILGYDRKGRPIWAVAGGAPTTEEIILSLDIELEQAQKRESRAIESVKTTLAKAKRDGRANLTVDEDADVETWLRDQKQAQVDIEGIKHKRKQAVAIKDIEDRNDERMREVRVDPVAGAGRTAGYDMQARVGREERTYHKGNTGDGGLFLRDITRTFLYRDPESEGRLNRHMREERVERGQYMERAAGDATTGAFAGLTVPQYLTDMYAPKARALRPFADACTHHDLPSDGMTVNISQITTGTTAAVQANEFDAVSGTSIDDTLLTENVKTASGQQSLSRQAIERGTGIEGVVMYDLERALSTALDSTLVNDGTTGLAALGVATAYTDGTPTGPEAYPKVLGAASGVELALLGFGMADLAVMHSRRWYWFQSQMTSTWPMMGQPGIGAQLAGINLQERYGAGVRGVFPNGMVIVTDNNCPTTIGGGTEDEIYIACSDECHLWEDPNAPQFIRAEQPKAANLAVTLVLYSYYAYCFRRFASAVGRVSGTGLIAPTFP